MQQVKWIATIIFCFAGSITTAQEKRALLIGINEYKAPKGYKSPMPAARFRFSDLHGPANDVRSFYSIITSKFYFPQKNIDTLINRAATREAILSGMFRLLDKCNAGDFAFIFYAGHGSQVINTLSQEADKKDESIVPADAYKPGVPDIRDKELAAIFNKFLDKGVKLTVMMDCCHSGSLSRGPLDGTKSRFMPDAGYDAKDATQPVPPETRKDGSFLIISASQDNEPAKEKKCDDLQMYGGFTNAFVKTMEQQSVNVPAQSLFTSMRAIIKSNGLRQEPVIAGSTERLQQTLFGFEKGSISDNALVAISGLEGKEVVLQGGFALGLYEENELAKMDGEDTVAVIRIDTVLGVNKSLGTVVRGNEKKIRPGDLLAITNWVSSKSPLLKVYIPQGNLLYEQVVKVAAVNKEIMQSKKVKWVNNLEKTDPYTTIFYDGNKCRINVDGKEQPAPKTISATSLLQYGKPDSSFYFEVPSTQMVNDLLKVRISKNNSLKVVYDPAEAHYTIFGTIDENGNPAYGLRSMQTMADNILPMPAQTATFSLATGTAKDGNDAADFLYEKVMKLSKIRGWLQLAPPANITTKFPFHLELINTKTANRLAKPEVKVGDKIAFHLVLDSTYDGERLFRKFMYAFLIDKDGNMILCYPQSEDGNQDNQFPKYDDKKEIVKEMKLFSGTVRQPVGLDNYYLLVCDEAIPNFTSIFNQKGVRAVPGNSNPLSNLLNMGNAGGTRSLDKSISNWTVLKLQVKSFP